MPPYRDEATLRPDVLACAGLDPSGGAGLIADVRVLAELGCRPVGVVTTSTIQNTTGVVGDHLVDAEMINHQLAFLLTDVEVAAVKLGMIGSAELARALGSTLQLTNAPLVWDPVLKPSRGELPRADAWIEDALVALRPHVTLVTPNAFELASLTGLPAGDLDEAEAAARHLARQLDAAVLAKGGHLGGPEAIDILIYPGGREELRGPRIANGEHVHGTGCALSSAIAAHLAHGRDLVEACRLAKAYVAARIADPARPGRGAPAVL
ncbi:MAG TPA: bifunctional hydroxymethylpyrimidine kinase/phosphomethylpyrimidine kinase [Kofleriaceae bacterium]|jgi:hydroxymethylpyrimidine kinase/phosphomethylpyrimidine kinase